MVQRGECYEILFVNVCIHIHPYTHTHIEAGVANTPHTQHSTYTYIHTVHEGRYSYPLLRSGDSFPRLSPWPCCSQDAAWPQLPASCLLGERAPAMLTAKNMREITVFKCRNLQLNWWGSLEMTERVLACVLCTP